MAISPTYPGVYVQEIDSGVRTVAGVPTSIAAFVGVATRGPVNQPVTCFNFGDYTRRFGGLSTASTMSYCIDDFFANGGGQCEVVRVFKALAAGDGTNDADGYAKLTLVSLKLRATSPGAWGNRLKGRIDHPEETDDIAATAAAAKYGVAKTDLFTLTVIDEATGAREVHTNLVAKDLDTERRFDRVLAASSQLVEFEPKSDGTPTFVNGRPSKTSVTGGVPDLIAAAKGNDGQTVDNVALAGDLATKTGMQALRKTDIFNLLCVPPVDRTGEIDKTTREKAAALCRERRALFVVDPLKAWDANPDTAAATTKSGMLAGDVMALANADHAALYFPRLRKRDPLRGGQIDTFPPCGAVAGVMARTDTQRGVFKAPAGLGATIAGVEALSVKLTDDENGLLNPVAANCLRSFPNIGRTVWGARTLKGSDQLSDDYKYVSVRRLALFIEESLFRGTQWVVFEGNDEPLWAQIRLSVGSFMQRLFLQGAFQGTSPKDAYFVKCDASTTRQDDINRGIVNIVVGFAPLQPAEFVVISIQQIRNAA
ncbi:phage tail sheath family protein [Parerythrobacter lacustris]|uniref:Phage tail sheath subtilisin-like domain-containing protein n=1 Tax=Parerythrobacter lacustris TaxID=2969984 RepID=A0ABT1XUD9_9SPHN|nr:phage tail sheath C-terminal domain-containing protein [Parerythrobacter lacustris]MCR2835285.1 phage tail sheath subtilisin-like domain-containing protein [Parerythrobacter lacustris]